MQAPLKDALLFPVIVGLIHFFTCGGIATLLGVQDLATFFSVYPFMVVMSFLMYSIVGDLKKMASKRLLASGEEVEGDGDNSEDW
jgi:hypothetical protein